MAGVVILSFRVTRDEAERLRDEAKAAGRTLTALLRAKTLGTK